MIDPAELVSVAGVHFRPGGAAAFFAPPIGELHGCHVPLDALWGTFARELRERLLEGKTPQERLDLLESALLTQALKLESHKRRANHQQLVEYALGTFARSLEMDSVGQVAGASGLIQRHFIDLFRRRVGISPKRFCRIRRFQRALQACHLGRKFEWTAVAADAGYFDQAHFIHNFQAFCGMTASAYQAARPWHPNHVPIRD